MVELKTTGLVAGSGVGVIGMRNSVITPALLKTVIVRLAHEHHISGELAETLIHLLGLENE